MKLTIEIDVVLELEPDQQIRAIASLLSEPIYGPDGIEFARLALHRPLKLSQGDASLFLTGQLFMVAGRATLRNVHGELDQFGTHPARLSEAAEQTLVNALFVKNGSGYTQLAQHSDFRRLAEATRDEKA